MTHAHRRRHQYAPPRVTAIAALAALGTVSLVTGVVLLVTAVDAEAAPAAVAPVRVCEQAASGGMRCSDRDPLWPASQTDADQTAFQRAAGAELGATVGLALRAGVVLVAVP